LFTLLLAGAVGSLATDAARPSSALRLIAILGGLLLVWAVGLPQLLSWTRALPITGRIIVSVLIVLPLGLLMGVPFASGVRLAGAERNRLVAWGWALNGGASVFGSTLAILISMTWGFGATFLVGAAAYGVALLALAYLRRSRSEADAVSKGTEQELLAEGLT
jgi:hypothetical protein